MHNGLRLWKKKDPNASTTPNGELVQVRYMGGPRQNLRGPVSKRSYGTVKPYDLIEVLAEDADYNPTIFVR